MEDPIATPRPPQLTSRPLSKDAVPSSSPAFQTPAFGNGQRSTKPLPPFAFRAPNPIAADIPTTTTVLHVDLPPVTLRPLAFRTLTKKHNLTLTAAGLQLLASFIGKHCGKGWREEGLAERVLDEVAKAWKRCQGGLMLDDGADKKLGNILKTLEPCIVGGRVDAEKLSRSNTSQSNGLSRQNSLDVRPNGGVRREDSQASFGMSALDVDQPEQDQEIADLKADARTYLRIHSSNSLPRLTYNTLKKTFDPITTPPTLFPAPSHKTSLFRDRYHIVHQRLLRNESFQTPSFSTGRKSQSLHRSASTLTTPQQAYKITPVANLLGRTGSRHILLGLLVTAPTGEVALTDLTGSIILDLSSCQPEPPDCPAWFCPGMIVLIDGIYEEDGSNADLGRSGGVGGTIGGRFYGSSIGGPPAERRDLTLGITKADGTNVGAGTNFGWVDFLGVGSEKAIGGQMRRLQRQVLRRHNQLENPRPTRCKMLIFGECNLDNPRVLEGIRAVLSSYTDGEFDRLPISIVFTGNFISAATMAGAPSGSGSIEYKEYFDALASVLTEFSTLLTHSTLVFVPSDNDPWASSFSAGSAVAIPREPLPEIFTSRIRRTVATANLEAGRRDAEDNGKVEWATNPARMSLFGPVEEIVLFRDDITGRLRRSAVLFSQDEEEEDEDKEMNDDQTNEDPLRMIQLPEDESMEIDAVFQQAQSHLPKADSGASKKTSTGTNDIDSETARKLVKTILDQGYLSPFPLSTRPVLWDYASTLSIYPLPTALVLADAEIAPFAVTYEGCHVMNPGKVVDDLGSRKGIVKWIEYDVQTRRGNVKEIRL